MKPRSARHSLIPLLGARRFGPLFLTQFLGAFNDNLYKNALLILLAFQASSWTTLAPEVLANLAAGIFILPFFVFSATAGQLADKFDKAFLARLSKVLEIVIMGVAMAGFFIHSLVVLLAALFLLGLQSTLFGSVKYAILPQHLHADELVGGNALVESGTFVAILLGTIVGGLLAGLGKHPGWIALGGFVVALAGYVASLGIPVAPPPQPGLRINPNPLTETWRNIGYACQHRTVFLSMLGISWFWLYGALLLTQIPVFGKSILGGSEATVTLLLAVFTVGIGLGSVLCDRISGKHLEIGLIPLGAIGLSVFGLDLSLASPVALPASAPLSVPELLQVFSTWRVLFDLLAIGLFGGFYIVPLYVLVQMRSDLAHRARIIAANNIINALFMVVGALGAAALLGQGVLIPALFALAALANALVALFICGRVSDDFLRFIAGILAHAMYRIDKLGLENIPEKGPAVLICNHVSFVDAIILLGVVRRPIRFVMDHRIYGAPLARFIFRAARTIPITTAKESEQRKEAAFAQIAEALAAGELIGLFPEGRITSDEHLNRFRYGVQRIVAETPVPVIPMALRGLWGSFFSWRYGLAMSQPWLIRLRRRIAVVAGEAVAPERADPDYLQGVVAALCDSVD